MSTDKVVSISLAPYISVVFSKLSNFINLMGYLLFVISLTPLVTFIYELCLTHVRVCISPSWFNYFEYYFSFTYSQLFSVTLCIRFLAFSPPPLAPPLCTSYNRSSCSCSCSCLSYVVRFCCLQRTVNICATR